MWWLFHLLFWVPGVWAITPVEQARNDYIAQYDQYRTIYRDYQLKLAQYTSAATFAREEELVTAAKQMLDERANVWWTYWQALRVDINDNHGIPDADKANMTAAINSEQTYLSNYRQQLTGIANHADLTKQAQAGNDKVSTYQTLSYQTNAALRQGRLLYAIEEWQTFGQAIKQAATTQILDPDNRNARLRGIDEALKLLDTSQADMVDGQIKLSAFTASYQPDQLYSETIKYLQPSYEQMKQASVLLQELAQDLEI